MILNILDRLQLLNGIMPKEGNIVTLRVILEAKQALGLTSEEIEGWGVKDSESGVVWDVSKDTDRDIEISPVAASLIRTSLKELDGSERLTPAHVSLWERFVENSQD